MSLEQIKDNFLNIVLNHYADFNGRARRREYWYYALVTSVISLVFSALYQASGWGIFNIIGSLIGMALLVPGLAVAWRRLHDIGKSGTWYLIVLVPLVGWVLLIYWLCQDSQPGDNEFGPNPKGM